uniref:Solute carrier family 2 member 12 n=1 Tax=Pipistrellus kuhlii TaxID=59472 RepID=A0A7J7YNW7_PIPKU|nr:solute carrier family 2 member 12 [Pipistrellus kuhlii]
MVPVESTEGPGLLSPKDSPPGTDGCDRARGGPHPPCARGLRRWRMKSIFGTACFTSSN